VLCCVFVHWSARAITTSIQKSQQMGGGWFALELDLARLPLARRSGRFETVAGGLAARRDPFHEHLYPFAVDAADVPEVISTSWTTKRRRHHRRRAATNRPTTAPTRIQVGPAPRSAARKRTTIPPRWCRSPRVKMVSCRASALPASHVARRPPSA